MDVSAAHKKVWTILDLINWGTSYLTDKGFDEARLNIELLTSHVLHLPRIQLYTNFDRPLNDDELALFKDLFKRRLMHEPIQYIIGATEFMGFPYLVNSHVLIPRPETEILVEHVVERIQQKSKSGEGVRMLDIGTGSGCIAVSIAKMLPHVEIVAIDISRDALAMAQENAARNGVEQRVEFSLLDVSSIDENTFLKRFNVIVSNPPYISTAEYDRLPEEVKNYEPSIALIAETDGLKYYRFIAHQGGCVLDHNGFIAVEHGYDQSARVNEILSNEGYGSITQIKDYAGHDRCLIAERE